MKDSRCVVFVDGGWNAEVVAFRKPFHEFARRRGPNGSIRLLTMTIDADDTGNDVWRICERIYRDYDIPQGGLKNFGGAGRVLWISNGRVVDYAWCKELLASNQNETVDELNDRTQRALP